MVILSVSRLRDAFNSEERSVGCARHIELEISEATLHGAAADLLALTPGSFWLCFRILIFLLESANVETENVDGDGHSLLGRRKDAFLSHAQFHIVFCRF